MGSFNNGDAPAGGLQPLTLDRIRYTLDAQGWKWTIDEDGDIAGGWEDGVYFFFVRGEEGEILYARGQWRGQLDEADFPTALETCNEWNSSHFWPKAYAARLEDGGVGIVSELAVDYEHGLTDAQLQQHLRCLVGTSENFFTSLADTFPQAAAAYREAGGQ